jgi:hypothetical protein
MSIGNAPRIILPLPITTPKLLIKPNLRVEVNGSALDPSPPMEDIISNQNGMSMEKGMMAL